MNKVIDRHGTNENTSGSGSNKKIIGLSVVGAMIVAVFGLVGYIPGYRLLGSIRAEFIPMAPSTAISFILLGFILLISIKKIGQGYRFCFIFISSIVSTFGFVKFAEFCIGLNKSFEEVVIGGTAKLGDIPIGIMSPSTGGLFFLSGISILLHILGRKRKNAFFENLSGIFGCIVLIGAFTFILGYLYGSPFLYGTGRVVPMAITTAVAFLLLAIGMVNMNGKTYFPLMLFAGPSVRS